MNLKAYSMLIGLTLATSIGAAKAVGTKFGFITYDIMLLTVLFFSCSRESVSISVIDEPRNVNSPKKWFLSAMTKPIIGFVMVLLLLSSIWPDLSNYVIAAVFLLASYSAMLTYSRLDNLNHDKEKAREALNIFLDDGPESIRTSLNDVEYRFRSQELCKAAVSRNASNFKYVPDDCKTSEIATIALKRDGRNLQYLAEDQITLDYVIAAVSQKFSLSSSKNSRAHSSPSVQRVKPIGSHGDDYDDESPFKFIPKQYLNEKIARLAIHFTPCAIRFFPADTVSDIVYANAMAYNGTLLLDVPFERRTSEICWAALNSKEDSAQIRLDDIPEKSRTVEIYKLIIDRDPNEFANVPDDMKTDEMCLISVSRSGAELSNVPLEKRSYAICHAAVEEYGNALEWVPMHCRDLAMYEAAIRNRAALSFVPEELKSKDLIMSLPQPHPAKFFWNKALPS